MTIEAESYDSVKSISLLKSFKDKYYFHGSCNPSIDILEPREANDVKDEWNRGNWVFATMNPTEAIIYSVFEISTIPKEFVQNTTWSVRNEDGIVIARMPKEWRPYVEKTVGSVYVLPKDIFKEIKGDHAKSSENVIPKTRVLVMLNDFEKMGGKVEWK